MFWNLNKIPPFAQFRIAEIMQSHFLFFETNMQGHFLFVHAVKRHQIAGNLLQYIVQLTNPSHSMFIEATIGW